MSPGHPRRERGSQLSRNIQARGLTAFGVSNFSSGGGGSTASAASFSLDLIASLIPTIAFGDGTPTFTRASPAAHTDFEGIVRQVPAGAFRPQGSRYVRNVLVIASGDTNDIHLASGINTATVTFDANDSPPGSGITGSTQIVSTSSFAGKQWANSLVIGKTYRSSVWAKGAVGGELSRITDTATGGSFAVTTTWRRYSMLFTAGGTSATVINVNNGDTIKYAGVMWEDVTGQTNTNPSEYVPSLATANADSGAIGVRYFPYLNGNTVTNNVVTEVQGRPITSARSEAALGVAAGVVDGWGPLGYLAEGTSTNIILWSRDMTNAAWTKGGTVTVAQTSTGVDGTANSATRITGGAVASTNTVTQLITAAATTRTYSVYIKRITGSGAINLSEDNFVGTSNVAGSLIANQWVKVSFSASILNPVIGIQVSTDGDAIDVDMNQVEVASFASSPIPTTTVSVQRLADVLTYLAAGNISLTAGSVYAEHAVLAGAGHLVSIRVGISGDVPAYTASGSGNQLGAFHNSANRGSMTITRDGTVQKLAVTWGNALISPYAAGVAGTTGVFTAPLINGGTTIGIGTDGTGASGWTSGTLRNIRLYPQPLSATKLVELTS